MIILLTIGVISKILQDFPLYNAMPLIMVLTGIFVITFGAFYDFGASKYLENVFSAGAKLRETDVTSINRQQFIMTMLYLLIGLAIIAIGFLTSLYL